MSSVAKPVIKATAKNIGCTTIPNMRNIDDINANITFIRLFLHKRYFLINGVPLLSVFDFKL